MRSVGSTCRHIAGGFTTFLFIALVAAPGRGVDFSPAPANDAQRLVFLLEYLGTDYDAAVRDGRIVNQIEYGEMLRLSDQLIEGYNVRGKTSEAVSAGLAEVQKLIKQRAAGEEVWATSRRLLPELASSWRRSSCIASRPPRLVRSRAAPCRNLPQAVTSASRQSAKIR